MTGDDYSVDGSGADFDDEADDVERAGAGDVPSYHY